MGILTEAASAPTQLQASLAAGLASISNNQTVSFQQYNKSVMVADGFVFWVASGSPVQVVGSLHRLSETVQEEDNTFGKNRIIFTTANEIDQFNTINPQTMWVGSLVTDGNTLLMSFNETAAVYQQAGLWHYSGDSVYPALQSQLVANANSLPTSPIVSNSLPIWLTQSSFAPVYPSFLVPDNITPPYIVAHVVPEATDVLGQFPTYTWPGVTSGTNNYLLPRSQLMVDRVHLTLYGFNNQKAIQYLSSLMDYSLNTDTFGFCNSPSIKDEKRVQSEIAVIAMKKTITIMASYYQSTADAVARKLILSASSSFTIGA